jgi:aspartyl-tRNA(Asn)/glutamyl-tRNA(Gln) amidotransferase subunit A
MTMPDPLSYESIASLSARIRAGRLSPVTCAEELLGRIDALDGPLHSFIRVMPERALAQAKLISDRTARD